MVMVARLACPRPDCPNVQPCATHARPAWNHGGLTRHQRGYGRLRVPVVCERGKGQHETWDSLRACVLERDGRRCGYCGGPATTADHRTAKALGGTDNESNLLAACRTCNQAKAGREGQMRRKSA